MALELSELRSFLVLAQHLHFGEAAEALHLSQPALTKQIQKLEAKVEGPLLLRGYRRVELTPAGEILRDRAQSLLREAEITQETARLAVQGKAGLLRIGFGIASLAAGLPDILTRFRKHFPAVQVTMRDMSTPDQIEALEQGDMDVGFLRLPVERPNLVTVPVLEERLVAAIPQGMSYRKGLAGLGNEPFVVIARSVSASFVDHLVRTCRAAGFSPRIVQEASELFTVLNLVRGGVGVSLVPRSANLMHVPNVRLLDTGREEAKWKIGLAWRNTDPLDPLVHNFIRLVRQPRSLTPTRALKSSSRK
ncbi:MAG: LysR substrate-binding domain-containing protein [Candidatus Acidiferrales bacterium]